MADLKTTQLDAVTTLADTDILYAISDVATTPLSKKITIANAKTVLNSSDLKLDQTTPQTIINGQPIWDTLTASKVVFTDASKKFTSTGIGTSSQFIKGDGSLDSSTYLTAVTAHNLLSATHGDTLVDTVVRGDVLIGNSTPKWSRLAFPATPTGKVLIASATDVTWSTNPLGTAAYAATGDFATASHTQNASTVLIPNGVGTPTFDDVQDFLQETRSAGRITGGVITAHAGPNGTVDISEMEGMIFTTNALGGNYIFFKQAAATDGLSLTDLSVNWIYFDWNGGSPRYLATTDKTTINLYNQFAIGRVWRNGNNVEIMSTGHNIYNKDRRAHDRLIYKYGNMDRVSGAVISAHATPLRLQATSGSWYVANYPFTTDAKDTFHVWYKTGGGAWTESAELTLFSEVFDGGTSKVYETYQNGTSLGALGANKYGVYWVYICPEQADPLYIVLGTASYNNVGEAQAASVPASLPPYCVNWAKLVGKVICQKTGAAFYSVETVFGNTFTQSSATDHASLGNLPWGSSGHSGTVSTIAGFAAGTGAATEYTLSGTGTTLPTTTAPTFVTSITTPSVLATANDSGALGASGTAFSDLFLASGGVINWLAGAVTITHSANTLTLGGSAFTTLALGTTNVTMTGSLAATGARVTKGWFTDIESTNMITVGGTSLSSTFAAIGQTMYIGTTGVAINRGSAALTLAGITLTTPDIGTPSAGTLTNCTGLPASGLATGTFPADTTFTYGEGTYFAFDTLLSGDEKFCGEIELGTAGATLAVGDLCSPSGTSGKWVLADAGVITAASGDCRGILGICILAANDTQATKMLLRGKARSAAFPAFTANQQLFVSETAGDITGTIPTSLDHAIRCVGYALTAEDLYFNPSTDNITRIA